MIVCHSDGTQIFPLDEFEQFSAHNKMLLNDCLAVALSDASLFL